MKLRSRINEMFTPEFLDEMFDLFKQHKFYVTGKDGKEERVQDVRHFKALTFRKKLSDYFKDTDDIYNAITKLKKNKKIHDDLFSNIKNRLSIDILNHF